jgi:hypothetical protein
MGNALDPNILGLTAIVATLATSVLNGHVAPATWLRPTTSHPLPTPTYHARQYPGITQ